MAYHKIVCVISLAQGGVSLNQSMARFLSAIQVSRSAFLTARLADDAQAIVSVVPVGSSLKSPIGLPRLKEIKEAGTILLRENSENSLALPIPPGTHEGGKRRDWLVLLLREHLGTISIIEPTQISTADLYLLKWAFSGPKVYYTFPDSRSGLPGPYSPILYCFSLVRSTDSKRRCRPSSTWAPIAFYPFKTTSLDGRMGHIRAHPGK